MGSLQQLGFLARMAPTSVLTEAPAEFAESLLNAVHAGRGFGGHLLSSEPGGPYSPHVRMIAFAWRARR